MVRDIAAEIEWAKVSQITRRTTPRAAGQRPAAASATSTPRSSPASTPPTSTVKRDRGVIDFEDVLLLTAGMIDDDAAMAATVRDQYRCLLVDEYQDVSPIQQRLLDLWLADRDDLTVVGDANQTIYSFAGATPRYLLDFRRRFPGRIGRPARAQLPVHAAGRGHRQPGARVVAHRRRPRDHASS